MQNLAQMYRKILCIFFASSINVAECHYHMKKMGTFIIIILSFLKMVKWAALVILAAILILSRESVSVK